MRPARCFFRALAALFVVASAAGCTTNGGGRFAPRMSVDAAKLSPAAASAVADDMVANLAAHIDPGTGTLLLKPDSSPFGLAFEQTLRNHGYAVAFNKETADKNMIPVAYVIDSFEGTVMGHISMPSLDLTRSYAVSENSAKPAGPLSVMQRSSTGEDDEFA